MMTKIKKFIQFIYSELCNAKYFDFDPDVSNVFCVR